MITYYLKDTSLIIFAALIAIASSMDIVTDLSQGATLQHIIKEAAIVVVALFILGLLVTNLRRQANTIKTLRQQLQSANATSAQASDYLLTARRQLSDVIARQFGEWALTQSEKQVGMLLLKGLSLKEIAALRNTLEKTVRQQASSIYKKAGLAGRHAFSAWFIEDFL